MRRISTATKVVDKFGPGKPGFTNGNAVTGVAATDLEDQFFDHLQEELCAVAEAKTGVVADGSSRTQVLTAIQWLIANATSGLVSSSQFVNSFLSNGYAKLPNGLVIQWGLTTAVASGGAFSGTFPIPFPTAGLRIFATSASSGGLDRNYTGGGEISSRSTFNIYSYVNGGGSGTYSWLAIGY